MEAINCRNIPLTFSFSHTNLKLKATSEREPCKIGSTSEIILQHLFEGSVCCKFYENVSY